MHRAVKTIFSLILLFSLFFNLCVASIFPTTYEFEHFKREDGLPHKTITSITQDKTGYLWFGTRYGISKYDGYNFKNYGPDILHNKNILSMVADDQGYLWIGTLKGGLLQLNLATNEVVSYKNSNRKGSISHNVVSSLFLDRNNILWVGTRGGGINRYDRETNTFINYLHKTYDKKGVCGSSISRITEGVSGILWIATEDNGVCQFFPATEQFKVIDYGGRNANERSVQDIFIDSSRYLWVGTNAGLFQYSIKNRTYQHFQYEDGNTNSLTSNFITSIIEDVDNNIWIGTSHDLNILEHETKKIHRIESKYYEANSISDHRITEFYNDRSGTLWIGTYRGGVNKFNARRTTFKHMNNIPFDENSLSNRMVWNVKHIGQYIWAGTEGGLNRYDTVSGEYKYYNNPQLKYNPQAENIVRSIISDGNGGLWLGFADLLTHFDIENEIFTSYPYLKNRSVNIKKNYILTLYLDNEGMLWIGTRGIGVNIFNTKTKKFSHMKRYNDTDNGLNSNVVYSIYKDKRGFLWFATYGGVNKYNPVTGKFTHYKHNINDENTLINNSVISMYTEDDDIFWFGTHEGLSRFNTLTNKFKNYKLKDGIANDHVYAITKDKDDNLWFSTNLGLTKLNLVTEKIVNFGVEDGLQGSEFNVNSIDSRDDILFFGGVNGVTIFDPSAIRYNDYLAPIVVISFKLFNEHVNFSAGESSDNPIDLSYRDNFFSIDFAALDYTAVSKIQYAYKLEGFDDDWIYSGNRHFASYTNLDGGDYIFKIKGTNSDGLWNESDNAIHIHISPPPWKTWWATLIIVLLFISFWLVVYFHMRAGYKIKTKQKELDMEQEHSSHLTELNRVKDEFLATTSHELRTPLNGIVGLAEFLFEDIADKISKGHLYQLEMIIISGKRLATLINDILDYSKLKKSTIEINKTSVDLNKIIDLSFSLSMPLIGKKPIKFVKEIGEIPSVLADVNRLQQILMNLIGNSVKFSPSGNITISAVPIGKKVRISVSDEGIGIPKDKLSSIFQSFEQVDSSIEREYGGTGLGLAITQNLVKLHDSEITVESELGKGTTFSFELPVSVSVKPAATNNIVDMNKNKPPPIMDNNISIPTLAPSASPARVTDTERKILANKYADTFTGVAADNISTEKPIDKNKLCPVNADRFKILVVDDESINRLIMNKYLSTCQYQVIEASNGADAIELISAIDDIDLVILDVMMPRVSGFTVCQELRKIYSPEALPVIFITADINAVTNEKVHNVGGNGFLLKPVSKNELLIRIKNLLASKNNNDNNIRFLH